MESKARCLLFFLLRVSRYGGECRPGYTAMKRAIRDTDADKGSNNTVRKALSALDKAGWIGSIKKNTGIMFIVLQIPMRFRKFPTVQTKLRLFTECTTGSATTAHGKKRREVQ